MPKPTPLSQLPRLAQALGLRRIWVKDEGRRALGNFKSLGGGHAVADIIRNASGTLPTLICASDGNHGLSVAAAARLFGAHARIFLPATVSEAREARIEEYGGEVVRVAGTYDEAVTEAAAAAARDGAMLVADTSSEVDDLVVASVMRGYQTIAREIIEQIGDAWPTHCFVQAGVGGLAAALAQALAIEQKPRVTIVVVEPDSAACVGAALAAGYPVQIPGDLHTGADMLACGLASASAVVILQAHRCMAITVGEELLMAAPATLRSFDGPRSTPSGAAGLAGLLAACQTPNLADQLQLNANSEVLLIATERSA